VAKAARNRSTASRLLVTFTDRLLRWAIGVCTRLYGAEARSPASRHRASPDRGGTPAEALVGRAGDLARLQGDVIARTADVPNGRQGDVNRVQRVLQKLSPHSTQEFDVAVTQPDEEVRSPPLPDPPPTDFATRMAPPDPPLAPLFGMRQMVPEFAIVARTHRM